MWFFGYFLFIVDFLMMIKQNQTSQSFLYFLLKQNFIKPVTKKKNLLTDAKDLDKPEFSFFLVTNNHNFFLVACCLLFDFIPYSVDLSPTDL